MTTRSIVTIALLLALAGGCATKRYGRMTTLTTKEADALSCAEVEDEIVECEAFLADVYSTGFSGADVAAVLGDFGIGNAMERDAALRSGKERLESLYHLRAAKCGVPFPEDWIIDVKEHAKVVAAEKAADRKRRSEESRYRASHRGDYIVSEPVENPNPWADRFGNAAPPTDQPARVEPSAPVDTASERSSSPPPPGNRMTEARWKSASVEERMAWCRKAVKLIGTDMTPEQLYTALEKELE